MYPWVVYLHVLATLTFLLAHGVSRVVAWRLKNRPDPAQARAWLELNANGAVVGMFYGSLLLLLISGIVSGFIGDWWGQGWIWLFCWRERRVATSSRARRRALERMVQDGLLTVTV